MLQTATTTPEKGVTNIFRVTSKAPERLHRHQSDVFILNFQHVSHLVLVFLLLTLTSQMPIENFHLLVRSYKIGVVGNNWLVMRFSQKQLKGFF